MDSPWLPNVCDTALAARSAHPTAAIPLCLARELLGQLTHTPRLCVNRAGYGDVLQAGRRGGGWVSGHIGPEVPRP